MQIDAKGTLSTYTGVCGVTCLRRDSYGELWVGAKKGLTDGQRQSPTFSG